METEQKLQNLRIEFTVILEWCFF